MVVGRITNICFWALPTPRAALAFYLVVGSGLQKGHIRGTLVLEGVAKRHET